MSTDQPTDGSFLRRLFNRSRSRTTMLKSSRSLDFKGTNSTNAKSPKPSPYTNPLISKPQARDEVLGGTLTAYQHLDGSIRAGVEGKFVAKQLYEGSVDNEDSIESLHSPSKGDSLFRREWEFYIKCYAEGRFNVSNPPEPPSSPELRLFPAPLGPNEAQRLQAVRECNLSSGYHGDKLLRLCILAKRVFQTKMAAVSLIDDKNEIFKAEDSFCRSILDRGTSIGAHALLSNEPMVILDASEDWRLKYNPLVQTEPHIRFYAGAPITCSNGDVVGVFAIFDDQPRQSFTAVNRRKLADFARLSMGEIELAIEERETQRRKNPLGFVRRRRQRSAVSDGDESLSPASKGDIMHQRLLRGIEEDAELIDAESRQSKASERSSSGSNTTIEAAYPKSHKPRASMVCHVTITASHEAGELRAESRTSTTLANIPTPPLTPSRPFSVSTLGSIFGREPYNDPPDSPSLPIEGPRLSESQDQLSFLEYSPPDLETSVKSQNHPFNYNPIKSLTEANFAMSIIARSLSYDFVYLLRIYPTRSDTTRHELMSNVINTQVLGSFKMPEPQPLFDGSLHLRALRSGGGLIYSNPRTMPTDQDCGYQSGVLLPLLRDREQKSPSDSGYDGSLTENSDLSIASPDPYCQGGIVLCAFKKTARKHWMLSADEVRCLREFGEAMRDILLKADMHI